MYHEALKRSQETIQETGNERKGQTVAHTAIPHWRVIEFQASLGNTGRCSHRCHQALSPPPKKRRKKEEIKKQSGNREKVPEMEAEERRQNLYIIWVSKK
jgi:hypothetical protein